MASIERDARSSPRTFPDQAWNETGIARELGLNAQGDAAGRLSMDSDKPQVSHLPRQRWVVRGSRCSLLAPPCGAYLPTLTFGSLLWVGERDYHIERLPDRSVGAMQKAALLIRVRISGEAPACRTAKTLPGVGNGQAFLPSDYDPDRDGQHRHAALHPAVAPRLVNHFGLSLRH